MKAIFRRDIIVNEFARIYQIVFIFKTSSGSLVKRRKWNFALKIFKKNGNHGLMERPQQRLRTTWARSIENDLAQLNN